MDAYCTSGSSPSTPTDSFCTSGNSPTAESVSSPSEPAYDLIFENHFSIRLIRPVSAAGKLWLDENVGDAETLTFGGAIVCEPRYVDAIAYGAVQAGLVVRM